MRKAEISRKTGETDITVKIDLDGSGKADISTGIGFFDHILREICPISGVSRKFLHFLKRLFYNGAKKIAYRRENSGRYADMR